MTEGGPPAKDDFRAEECTATSRVDAPPFCADETSEPLLSVETSRWADDPRHPPWAPNDTEGAAHPLDLSGACLEQPSEESSLPGQPSPPSTAPSPPQPWSRLSSVMQTSNRQLFSCGIGAVMTLHTAAQSPFPDGGLAAPRPIIKDSPMALWPARPARPTI